MTSLSARIASTLGVALAVVGSTQAQAPPTQNPPVPKPFPVGAPPSTTAKPDPAGPTGATAAPQVPGLAPPLVYPASEFLQALDAGRGQTFYLYGTDQPYAAIVEYYRGVLKTGGRELTRAPAMQQFDLGRFDDATMAYPPSVVVKDYLWNGSEGYLMAQGTNARRYRTVIQIVPARASTATPEPSPSSPAPAPRTR